MLKKRRSLFLLLLTLCLTLLCSFTAFAAEGNKSGLKKENGKIYYYNKGKKIKNKWKTVKGKQYYFSKTGAACKGFKKIGKDYYYFNSKCRRTNKKLVKVKGKYYYFLANGKAVTGIAMVNKKLWLFNNKGVRQSESAVKEIRAATKLEGDFDVLEQLIGTAKKISKGTSCYYGPGYDGIYEYVNFTVYTYEENGQRIIKGID